jgi:hypothetical protein
MAGRLGHISSLEIDFKIPGGTTCIVSGDISPQLRRFIQTTINSVEELEVLLFMMSNPHEAWSPQDISDRTRLPVLSVETRLKELVKVKLVAVEGEPSSHYRYAPNSRAIAEEVATSLNEAYRERKDTVIQLIYSRPFDNIRVFADAFRIKEEE